MEAMNILLASNEKADFTEEEAKQSQRYERQPEDAINQIFREDIISARQQLQQAIEANRKLTFRTENNEKSSEAKSNPDQSKNLA